jgi:2-methylcitrate dehydratase PrpD
MRLDPDVAATASRIHVNADARYGFASAQLRADMGNAEPIGAEITVAKGHPGNALSWEDMQEKFTGLVHFSAPKDSALLFSRVQQFGAHAEVDVLRKAAEIMHAA